MDALDAGVEGTTAINYGQGLHDKAPRGKRARTSNAKQSAPLAYAYSLLNLSLHSSLLNPQTSART